MRCGPSGGIANVNANETGAFDLIAFGLGFRYYQLHLQGVQWFWNSLIGSVLTVTCLEILIQAKEIVTISYLASIQYHNKNNVHPLS